MKKIFISNGIVLGNYWGGGSGSYAATTFHSNISKEDLIKQNSRALKNGNLDSGMGFESLIGALISIKTKTIIIYEDKEFFNEEYEDIFIGNLIKKQRDFLEGIRYSIE